MKKLLTILLVSGLFSTAWAEPTAEQPDRNEKVYNLEGSLGLKGYDPVAFQTENKAIKGDVTNMLTYGGVVYHFANNENMEIFMQDPTRYEPTYGGFCAYAMSQNAAIDIIPELFTIAGKRSHFFFSRRAKALFDRDLKGLEPKADANWKTMSGEEPRI